MPFLDREVIDWAMRLPIELKIPRQGEMEKQCCGRRSPAGCPRSCSGGSKAQFGDGSGHATCSSDEVAADIGDAEFEAERYAVEPPLRTKEELVVLTASRRG